MAAYDAFVSYSHARDKPIAAALQSAIQRLGKPWYRRRALRVFRDDTSLSATPSLWPSIEQALEQSRFLILLASPEAAASSWVDKEISHWLEHKSVGTLLIALTDGSLSWDNTVGDFGRSEGTPLPPALTGRFASEPKWVDLTAYRDGADPRDSRFIELAADFAAALHGMPKEDLLSQEVRQQRRALRLAWSAAGLLLFLAGLAGWQSKIATDNERAAIEQKQIAEQQRDRAEKTLAAATATANTLVRDLASEFRHRVGMPVDLVRKILERAQALQRELTDSGETAPELRYSAAMALDELVLTLSIQGDAAGALAAAVQSRDMLENLLAGNPDNEAWQRSLAVIYGKIGEIFSLVGRREEALTARGRSVNIFVELSNADPSNVGRQADLSIGYGRLGDALVEVGRRTQAIEAYRIALALLEKLNAADPANVDLQVSTSITHDRIGDVLRMDGRREEAIEAYRKSLVIRENLVATDPDNTDWQRGLSISYERVGDMLAASKSQQEALEVYHKSLAIIARLAATDTGNGEWQRDLSVTHDRIGNVFLDMGRREDAVRTYRQSLAIREGLAAADAGNPQSQDDLVISLVKLAQAGDQPRAQYTRALAIGRRLDAEGVLTTSQRNRIKMIEGALAKLSDVVDAQPSR
jgi:tetratricopeptide (TPR) repeat protein